MSYPSYPPPEQPYSGYPNPPAQPYPSYPPPPAQPYPGYPPPPAQPYSGYPPPPAPPQKSKVGKILLIVLAAVLVLCCGGGTGAYFLFKDDVKEIADASQTRLVAPDTLAGRPKSTDSDLQELADDTARDMKQTIPKATSSVAAFYGDATEEDLIMIFGVSGIVSNPTKALDDAIRVVKRDLNLTNVRSVDAGPLGGNAKCGDGLTSGIELGVCVWVDRGSLGMIVAYQQTGDGLAAEFVKMRGEIQKRA